MKNFYFCLFFPAEETMLIENFLIFLFYACQGIEIKIAPKPSRKTNLEVPPPPLASMNVTQVLKSASAKQASLLGNLAMYWCCSSVMTKKKTSCQGTAYACLSVITKKEIANEDYWWVLEEVIINITSSSTPVPSVLQLLGEISNH